MPESFNFKVNVPGANSLNSRPKLTLVKAINLIKQKGYTADMEEKLIKAITRMPVNTYEGFFKDIQRHIERISKPKKEEE